MFRGITLAIDLTASVLFTEYWLHGNKRPRVICMGISAALGVGVYCVFSAFWQAGAFFAAMAAGQVSCLVYNLIFRDCQTLLPKLCVYLGIDMVLLPLCLCGENIWEYAAYMSVLLLCAALTPVSKGNGHNQERGLGDLYHENPKYYWLISLMPCSVLIPDILILTVVGNRGVYSAMVLSAVFLLFFALTVCFQREVLHRLNAEYLNDAMTRWQSESRDYMNTIRSQRHDFNLHLHAISGLVGSQKYEKCREYVQKLVSDANAVNDIMPVSDAVVGSMLYNMREEARLRGSDIIYHITYDMEDILCNGFECNKIIGNLLQNAIDSLQTPEDMEYGIRLRIFKRRGNTVIITENRFTGDPDTIARVFEPGYSTKKGHEGIGLSMVLRTANRYGGRVYPEFEEEKIRFVVNIPNKVRLPEGD